MIVNLSVKKNGIHEIHSDGRNYLALVWGDLHLFNFI
jgi:hypothetical protein